MISKAEQQKREGYKALTPRIHEVQTRGRNQFHFNTLTGYDQRLWPDPKKVEKHGTG